MTVHDAPVGFNPELVCCLGCARPIAAILVAAVRAAKWVAVPLAVSAAEALEWALIEAYSVADAEVVAAGSLVAMVVAAGCCETAIWECPEPRDVSTVAVETDRYHWSAALAVVDLAAESVAGFVEAVEIESG